MKADTENSKIKVNIFFDKTNHSKKYSYEIDKLDSPTKEKLAYAISEAMVLSNQKHNPKSRLNLNRYYNLIFRLLENNTNIHSNNSISIDTTAQSFKTAKLFNEKESPKIFDSKVTIKHWRVGISTDRRLGLDLDSRDPVNLYRVKEFYENILKCKFTVFKTNGGYWLISDKEYTDKNEWLYDNCRFLYPELKKEYYYRYKESLLSLDTKTQLATPEIIKKSGLFRGVGSFDIAFVFINIKRGKMTLRISKKRPDDKIELLA